MSALITKQNNLVEKIDKTFIYVSALVVIALPFGIKPTSYAIFFLGLVWLLQNNFKTLINSYRTNKLLWLYSIPFVLMLLSLFYTQNFPAGTWELEKGIALLILPVIFSSTKKLSVNSIQLILRAFILSNVAFGLICIGYAVYKYSTENVSLFFYFDLVGIFQGHPTYYSMYILFSLASLYYLNITRHREDGWESNKWIISLIVLFFSILIFLLSIRFIFLIFCVIVIVSLLLFILRTKKVIHAIVLLLAFVVLTYVGLSANDKLRVRLLEFKDNYTYKLSESTQEGFNGLTTRLAQWELSTLIIKQSPIVGIGPGDVQDELQKAYKSNFLKYAYSERLNAHNQYVQTCLGLGIVGLTVFVAGLLVPAFISYKQKNFIYLSFLTLFAICCITESMLYVQKGIVFYAFFNSLFAFHLLQSEPDDISLPKA